MENEYAVYMNTILGGAIGYTLDGLSRAHIRAEFKNTDHEKYFDISSAVKHDMNRWKKPGLYPASIQLLLLFAMKSITKRDSLMLFSESIVQSPEVQESEYSFLRNASLVERQYYNNIIQSENIIIDFPQVHFIHFVIPICYSCKNKADIFLTVLEMISRINKNYMFISSALLFAFLLYDSNGAENRDFISLSVKNMLELISLSEKESGRIFNAGLNPETFMQSLIYFEELLISLTKRETADIDLGEKIIFDYVNELIKTPITRGTVNYPLALIPFAILLAEEYEVNYPFILHDMAFLGGDASLLSSLVAALLGSSFGEDIISQQLLNDLINKKRLEQVVNAIVTKKVKPQLITDFIQNEASLTAKEISERNAKLKHMKVKVKKQKSRKDIEHDINTHIVESWTKRDKAKWKKERKKSDNFQKFV